MYNFHVSEHLLKILKKLAKKDKCIYDQVLNKIDEIVHSGDVEHYKNLRYTMKDSKSVHIGSFVLIFQFDKKNQMINFDDFDHHDIIYKKKR
jgi:YafQ family addiction module toxin component